MLILLFVGLLLLGTCILACISSVVRLIDRPSVRSFVRSVGRPISRRIFSLFQSFSFCSFERLL